MQLFEKKIEKLQSLVDKIIIDVCYDSIINNSNVKNKVE